MLSLRRFCASVPHASARIGGTVAVLAPLCLGLGACAKPEDPGVVRANENRIAGGSLRRDTLTIRLAVRMADWRPESDSGPSISVAAFAEEGKAPRIPAPLIRVREGTVIAATVRNALTDSTVAVVGLATRPVAKHDTLYLKPGESKEVRFIAGTAGTYLYRAVLGNYGDREREQAAGAFVVDPAGGAPPDRIFVLNIWSDPVDSTSERDALTINGRSWPWTERISAIVGDTMSWRVVNATNRPHPMHLHGAYFRVDSKGDAFGDTLYANVMRRLAVTEEMAPQQTMSLAWSPVRPGRWLFHCHIAFHVIPTSARLNPAKTGSHDEHSSDPLQHMAGLVVGIDAKLPPGAREAERTNVRRLDLFVQEGKARGRSARALGFVLQQGAGPPAVDSVVMPGTTIVLTRDEPTDIQVHNRLKEPTSVHWHGLELESHSDGVAGWSGSAGMPAPPVAPAGSFIAHLSMPRAGTFMYHTHLRDLEQLSSGLYGAIVVMEPGQPFDPLRDHVHVVGWDGKDANVHLLVNGDSLSSPPIGMRVGETHRFRFVNIGAAAKADFTIRRGKDLVTWRAVAKDGADLPREQAIVRKAELLIDVGETYDFEFTPDRAGDYTLSTPVAAKGVTWTRHIRVREK